jgi:photosystem II stability/assembly factor-like uncharacterized protein
MVDLMMWLVIAAMLLATALQGIGYYQKAAYMYQMKSDLDGAGSRVVAASSQFNGVIDMDAAEAGVADAKWSADVSHSVRQAAVYGSLPYIYATHPQITDKDAFYLFRDCFPYKVGVNVIPKGGGAELENCGVDLTPADPGAGGGSGLPADGSAPWTSGPWTEQKSDTDPDSMPNVWYSVSMSNDGNFVALAPSLINATTIGLGSIHTSSDGGTTWVERKNSPVANWKSVAVSADGATIVAGQYNGGVWISRDYGFTWAQTTVPDGRWYKAMISDSGKDVMVAPFPGIPYISHDFGATWAPTGNATATDKYYGASMSGDGTKLALAEHLHEIKYSTNGGATWQDSNSGEGYWYGLASSLDGSKLVATEILHAGARGRIMTSSDFGVTWALQTGAPISNWRGAAMSADGTKIIAGQLGTSNGADRNGKVMLSTDSGVTWTATPLPAGDYYNSAMSNDGSNTIALDGIAQKIYKGVTAF